MRFHIPSDNAARYPIIHAIAYTTRYDIRLLFDLLLSVRIKITGVSFIYRVIGYGVVGGGGGGWGGARFWGGACPRECCARAKANPQTSSWARRRKCSTSACGQNSQFRNKEGGIALLNML